MYFFMVPCQQSFCKGTTFGRSTPSHTRGRLISPSTSSKRRQGSTPTMAHRPVIVSFDVDGTLVRSIGDDANKLHKEAFSEAFRQVFGLDTTIDVIEHHGSTDGLILVRVVEFHGIDKEDAMQKLPDMQQVMIDYFEQHKDRAAIGLEVLPGVERLLKELQKLDHVYVGLCTGNLEPIAWSKMEALGLKGLFTSPNFGGFGSDYCSGASDPTQSYKDRAELVKTAATRASSIANIDVQSMRRFHVGDAPMDVQAAVTAGSSAIGLLTGIFSRDDLQTCCSTEDDVIILPSLEDTDHVLDILLGSL